MFRATLGTEKETNKPDLRSIVSHHVDPLTMSFVLTRLTIIS